MKNDTENVTYDAYLSLDKELKGEFLASVQDNIDGISSSFQLLDTSENLENLKGCDNTINCLFRDVHSLKGNCRMVSLDSFSEVLHHYEEIVARLREHKIPYHKQLGHFLLLSVEEIQYLITELSRSGELHGNKLEVLMALGDGVANCKPDRLIRLAEEGVDVLEGALNIDEFLEHAKAVQQDSVNDKFVMPTGVMEFNTHMSFDELLESLQDEALAEQIYHHSTECDVFEIANAEDMCEQVKLLNEALNCPIPLPYLIAATLVHEMVIPSLSAEVVVKSRLEANEIEQIKSHVKTGNKIFAMHQGWYDSAMILQDHHTFYNAEYIPHNTTPEVDLGARLFQVIDAFNTLTKASEHTTQKRRLFSSMMEINANATTIFDPDVVQAFNDVVKHLIKGSSTA